MPIAIAIIAPSIIRGKCDTLAFTKQINQALANHRSQVRVRIQTPLKDVMFTASVDSAHSLIMGLEGYWSGAELTITIQ